MRVQASVRSVLVVLAAKSNAVARAGLARAIATSGRARLVGHRLLKQAARAVAVAAGWRPPPLTAASLARRELYRLDTTRRWGRFRRRVWRLARVAVADTFGSLWVIGLALLPALLPLGSTLSALATRDAAASFLTTLWQVQGTAVVLTITVVLFIFQVFSTRSRGSLHEFAEETGFFPIFYAGVSGIALDGLVLVGFGHRAPAGWAATWTATWALITLVLLAVLFVRSLRSIDIRSLHARRLRRGREQVAAEVERVIFERLASLTLIGECERLGITAEGSPPAGSVALKAHGRGMVQNVRLAPLRRAAREARAGMVAPPRLAIYIGAPVDPDSDWIYVQPVIRNQVLSLGRALKIRRRERESIRDTIAELHDDALQAIRAPAPTSYDEIVDTYAELLLGVPETWARYGQTLESDVGVSVSQFELTFFDLLRSNLFEEALHAMAANDRDVIQSIINLPIDVAARASEAGAQALAGQMLQLFVGFERELVESTNPHRPELLDWSWLRLYEYGVLVEQLLREDELGRGRKAMLRIYVAFAELVRDLVEHDPAIPLAELNSYWNDVVGDWHPEHAEPRSRDVELMREHLGPNDPRVRAAAAAAEQVEARIRVKEGLETALRVHRFGLCFWTLRRFRQRRNAEWLSPFRTFAGYLGDVSQLAEVFAAALEMDHERGVPWSDWVLHELPKRQVHAMSVDDELARTFVVLALEAINPDGDPPRLPTDLWLVSFLRTRDPQLLVDNVLSDETLAEALPTDRRDDRAALLIGALRQAVEQRDAEEDQRALEAPLDQQLVSEFIAAVNDRWQGHRLIRAAFAAAGAIEEHDEVAPEAEVARRREYLSKRLFVAEPHVIGHLARAGQVAVGPSRAERERFLEASGADAQLAEEGAALGERLRATIAELRATGLAPGAVFTPFEFRLIDALGLEVALGYGGEARLPHWLEGEAHAHFVGAVEGVPVVQVNWILADRLLVIDFGAFARFREWPVAEGLFLNVDVRLIDADRASELAAPEGLAGAALAERVREIRGYVEVEVAHAFSLVDVAPTAYRWLAVPDEFRAI